MKAKRFTDEQIIAVLREAEAGAKVAELCRKHGISEQTYYNWKAKFGGMTASDARRLKECDDIHAISGTKVFRFSSQPQMVHSVFTFLSAGKHQLAA